MSMKIHGGASVKPILKAFVSDSENGCCPPKVFEQPSQKISLEPLTGTQLLLVERLKPMGKFLLRSTPLKSGWEQPESAMFFLFRRFSSWPAMVKT